MFDGVLAHYEPRPDWRTPEPPAWPWELTALVLTLTAVAILASVLFPNAIADPSLHF